MGGQALHPARLRQVFKFFFEILFWPVIGPQGVFWEEEKRNRRKKRQRILKMGSKTSKHVNYMFFVVCVFCVVFSDSLAFSASIALFFVPKDLLGPECGPKQNVKNT